MKYQTILSPVLLISTLASARVLKLPAAAAAAAASESCITFPTGGSACGDSTTLFGATWHPMVTITKSYTTQTGVLRLIPTSVNTIGEESITSHGSDSFCATKTVTIIVTNSRGQNETHSTFTVGTASVTGARRTENSSASESSQHGGSTDPSVYGPTPCADNPNLECINQGGIPLTIGSGITTITDMPLSAGLFGSHTETGTKTGPGVSALTSSPGHSSGSHQTETKSSTSVVTTLTIGGIDYNTAPTAKAANGRGGYNKRDVAVEHGRGGYNKRDVAAEHGRGGYNKRVEDSENGRGGYNKRVEDSENGRGGYNKRDVAVEHGRGGYNKRDVAVEHGRGGYN